LVSSRTNFDRDLVRSLPLSPVCRVQLFPRATTSMKHFPIDLSTISGIFWVWMWSLILAGACFLLEILLGRKTRRSYAADESNVSKRDGEIWRFYVLNEEQRQWAEEEIKRICSLN